MTGREFEQGLVEATGLLWKNCCKGTLLHRSQEGVHLGTLITYLPSWPMSTLPTTFLLYFPSSLILFFFPRNYSVHHQLRMDLADTPPCMWSCLNTLCVENILLRISLCTASNASSGNERLQLDTHSQKCRLSSYVTSSNLLNVLAALLWTLSSLSTTLSRCP